MMMDHCETACRWALLPVKQVVAMGLVNLYPHIHSRDWFLRLCFLDPVGMNLEELDARKLTPSVYFGTGLGFCGPCPNLKVAVSDLDWQKRHSWLWDQDGCQVLSPEGMERYRQVEPQAHHLKPGCSTLWRGLLLSCWIPSGGQV